MSEKGEREEIVKEGKILYPKWETEEYRNKVKAIIFYLKTAYPEMMLTGANQKISIDFKDDSRGIDLWVINEARGADVTRDIVAIDYTLDTFERNNEVARVLAGEMGLTVRMNAYSFF